ncbi:MAG: polynucleotide kinase-phosphatase [Deltaproteobacteria bacterium]|jgi:protein phosphatase|nr:polynucleotide kinase-phosphatase [Deltaproteobacteria bacterium]
MLISLFDKCLVCLIGSSGSGKTTFGRKHFKDTEVLSSDAFRGMVSDDETDQSATVEAFSCLHHVTRARLRLGRLTVVDATNLRKEDRAHYLAIARENDLFALAIVLDPGFAVCQKRNALRPERASLSPRVLRSHHELLRISKRHLGKEGFKRVFFLDGPEEIEAAEIVREPLRVDKRAEKGPFDVIGDVHGCYAELIDLLTLLGYAAEPENHCAAPPPGRKAVFLGDLLDRGPDSARVLRLVMNMVQKGDALCVLGNHENKFMRHLSGHNVQRTHGLNETLASMESKTPEFVKETKNFLERLTSHYVLDEGRLVVAHAGLPEKWHGRSSGRVRQFCLYGETTGELDGYGLPVRLDWTGDYKGAALVLYGHVPALEVKKTPNTMCLDTGCVFGGRLTALRYPEKEIVSVEARREHYQSLKPLVEPTPTSNQTVRLQTVIGEDGVETSLLGRIRVAKERKAAALPIMARFAVDPRWLIYLPPTMSPSETSERDDYLEHPLDALKYYEKQGAGKVILETKHMGSRAVVVVARSPEAAKARFGVEGGVGVVYSRLGRPFFKDEKVEAEILERLIKAFDQTEFWSRMETDWVALDCELMPWSAKAESLLVKQYAPVGLAGLNGLNAAVGALRAAADRRDLPPEASAALADLAAKQARRLEQIPPYMEAWRRYCWPVRGVEGLKLAPFQILAVEGRNLAFMGHEDHLKLLNRHLGPDPLFGTTPYLVVDASSGSEDHSRAEDFWLKLTEAGGEGMVVKPWLGLPEDLSAIKGKVCQPAVKCRGREYLRIIYGPEYLLPDNFLRLKKRNLKYKRSLALREYALGLEALDRFVNRASLDRVHECVFSVLALETEPVDPRL